MPTLLFSLLLVFGLLPRLVSAQMFLYDGIAALVGADLITLNDAYFYRAVQRLREGTGSPVEREEGEALRKTVQRVAFERMVELEVKSLGVELMAPQQVVAEIAKMKKAPSNYWSRVLQMNGRTSRDAEKVLGRMILVERFLQKKLDTLSPIITDAEVERYFEQNQSQYPGKTLESLRADLVGLLKKERVQKGLEEWIRFLKGKYGLSSYLDA